MFTSFTGSGKVRHPVHHDAYEHSSTSSESVPEEQCTFLSSSKNCSGESAQHQPSSSTTSQCARQETYSHHGSQVTTDNEEASRSTSGDSHSLCATKQSYTGGEHHTSDSAPPLNFRMHGQEQDKFPSFNVNLTEHTEDASNVPDDVPNNVHAGYPRTRSYQPHQTKCSDDSSSRKLSSSESKQKHRSTVSSSENEQAPTDSNGISESLNLGLTENTEDASNIPDDVPNNVHAGYPRTRSYQPHQTKCSDDSSSRKLSLSESKQKHRSTVSSSENEQAPTDSNGISESLNLGLTENTEYASNVPDDVPNNVQTGYPRTRSYQPHQTKCSDDSSSRKLSLSESKQKHRSTVSSSENEQAPTDSNGISESLNLGLTENTEDASNIPDDVPNNVQTGYPETLSLDDTNLQRKRTGRGLVGRQHYEQSASSQGSYITDNFVRFLEKVLVRLCSPKHKKQFCRKKKRR